MKKQDESDYIPEGYARVTEVLQPFTDFSAIDPTTLAQAADRGSRVHKYCEMHALNLFVCDYDEDCKNYVESFKEWFDEMVESVVHNEVRMNSKKYRVSGKFDMIVKIKGDPGLTIVDLKTPASHSLSYPLQTAAYRLLAQECLNVTADRRICLMLPKHGGKAKVFEHTDHEKDQDLFLQALKLYRHFNK
jgi:hypothetical protein